MTGVKTAGWLLGHLAVSGDFARRLCGQPLLCPSTWASTFAPGSVPSGQPDDYPPMSTLIDVFFSVYRDLIGVALKAESQVLDAPNPYEAAQEGFPTTRDFVAYLMMGHLAYHLGQLTAWRGAAGLGRLPGV